MNVEMASGLEQRWISVRDAQGREQLQARWVDIAQAAQAAATPANAA